MPHIHEKIDFTTTAYIVYQNKVLLRMHDKYKIWLGVGGHVELDEDPVQAVIREVKEEVGLDIQLPHSEVTHDTHSYKILEPPRFMNRHKINDTHEHLDLIYFAKSATDNVVPGEGEEDGNWKWFDKEELEKNKDSINKIIFFYAKSALEELGS